MGLDYIAYFVHVHCQHFERSQKDADVYSADNVRQIVNKQTYLTP